MTENFWKLLIPMALTTYLVRMIPFAFFRSQIHSKFIRDFLYYVPYCVLGAMTVPYIFYAGGSTVASIAGFAVAFVMAYFRFSLLSVAGAACAVAYVAEIALKFIF
ncbi:MAG: AzlD domain-containing protein [Ruminococcaceae bacterium]|nr:AzlD domain-containing protein [Oscillospiraceae bacterium]